MFRYQEVKQDLLEKLAKMEPHTRLPSRAELCEELLISRTTIDRTIAELLKEGYLYTVPGGGTYAADLTAGNTPIRSGVRNIGVLVPNIQHDTYPGILRGIGDVLQRNNVNAVICSTYNDLVKQQSCLRRLLNSRVDGILMVPAILKNQQPYEEGLCAELAHLSIPLVLLNRSIDGVRAPLVCSNDYYGGYIATRHLLEKGYDQVAYLTPLHYSISMSRLYGYQAALWELGLPYDVALVRCVQEEATVELGYRMMTRLLEERPDVNGVFCFNDRLACGAINAIQEKGLRVSADIGVIGYDNTDLRDVPATQLSSVSFKKYEIGCTAAEILLQRIAHPEQPVDPMTVFRPVLCEGASSLGIASRKKAL